MNETEKKIHRILRLVRKRTTKTGQAFLEFALVIPIFLLLVFGVFEFGRYLTAIITINTASREAARYGAAVGKNASGVPYYQDCTGINDAATEFGLFAAIHSIDVRYDHGPDDLTEWDLLPTCSSTLKVGLADRIVVHVTGEYRPIILFNDWVIPLESTTSRTLVTKLDVRSTQYPVDTPEPEETPETDYCDLISISTVTKEDDDTYSFDLMNGNESFHAILDEIWITHSKVGPKRYLDSIALIDVDDEGVETLIYTETYTGAIDAEQFNFLPYNESVMDLEGNPVGVPPMGTTRIRFTFTDSKMTWSVIQVIFFNTVCPLIK